MTVQFQFQPIPANFSPPEPQHFQAIFDPLNQHMFVCARTTTTEIPAQDCDRNDQRSENNMPCHVSVPKPALVSSLVR